MNQADANQQEAMIDAMRQGTPMGISLDTGDMTLSRGAFVSDMQETREYCPSNGTAIVATPGTKLAAENLGATEIAIDQHGRLVQQQEDEDGVVSNGATLVAEPGTKLAAQAK